MTFERSSMAAALAAPKPQIDISEMLARFSPPTTDPAPTLAPRAVSLPYGYISALNKQTEDLQAQRAAGRENQLLLQKAYRDVAPFLLSREEGQAEAVAAAEGGKGIFDAPLLGWQLDTLDTGRSAMVSTIHEVTDIFGEGDASFSDWWNQAEDNQMASELLRNWGVDLDGPAGFAAGLTLDILFDPLTYAYGAGVIARFSKTADVIMAADKAADVARVAAASKGGLAAGKATEAQFRATVDILRGAKGGPSGVVAATAKQPLAMKELGINAGIHFSIPGTGRVLRRIVERPLTSVVPPLKRAAARHRVNAVARAPWSTPGLDLSVASNRATVVKYMTSRSARSGIADDIAPAVQQAARRAGRLPIGFKAGPGSGQASASALSLLTSPLGRAITRSSTAGWIAGKAARAGDEGTTGLAGRLNSQARVTQYKRGASQETAMGAFHMERFGNQGALTAGRWNKTTLDELDQLVRAARLQGIEGDDFGKLLLQVAETPDDAILGNPSMQQWVTQNADGVFEVNPLVAQAKGFWKSAGERAGIPASEVEEFFFAAHFRDDIAFGRKGRSSQTLGDEGLPLSGNPAESRHLMFPDQIVPKMKNHRLVNLAGSGTKQSRAYAEDIAKIEAKAKANLASRQGPNAQIVSPSEAQLADEFEAVMRADLVDGVRYGDGSSNVMTNSHVGQVIKNPSEGGGGILVQMEAIYDKMVGGVVLPKNKAKAAKFSNDASKVMPRYINVMTAHIRSQTILNLAVQEGKLLPGSKFAQGALATQIARGNAKLVLGEEALDAAMKKLSFGDIDESEHAHLLADIAEAEGITPGFAENWLKSADGEIGGLVAGLQLEIDTFRQVLRAAEDGKFYTGLDQGARDLLDARGWRDAIDGPFTAAQRAKIQKLAADSEGRLAALADATEFLHQLQLMGGRLGMQRDQLGAIVAQWDVGAQGRSPGSTHLLIKGKPGSIRQKLESQAAQMDELFDDIKGVADNIKGNLEAFDPTLVAGRGLQALGDPALMAKAKEALHETLVGLWAATEDFRRVAATFTDLPVDGRYVRLKYSSRKGGHYEWNIQWNSRPMAGLDDQRTLATLMGEDRVTAMRRVLATLDDSPAGRAQANLLEMTENTRILEQRLGNLTPGVELMEAVWVSLGDAKALQGLLRREFQTDLDIMVDSFLDQRLGAEGLKRRPQQVRDLVDELSTLSAQKKEEIEAIVERIQTAAVEIKNKDELLTVIRAEMSSGVLGEQRVAAHKAAKAGDTAAAVSIADDQMAAVRAVAKGQGNAAFVDEYIQGVEGVVDDMLHSYGVTENPLRYGRTGALTKSKLNDYSFVAPLRGNMAPADVEEMGVAFAEMFEAVARTADVEQLGRFFQEYSKFQNWWKAQAVGTPGFVMRNMLGAAWMNNQLAGMPLSTMPRVVAIRNRALKATPGGKKGGDVTAGLDALIAADKPLYLKSGMVSGGIRVEVSELKTFREWYTSGIASGTGGRGMDLNTALDTGSFVEGSGFRSGLREGTWKPTADFKFFAGIRGWNTDVEFMARGSLAHHTMMGGQGLDTALTQVHKYHFDYTDLTHTERIAKQFIPFWTWQRRALPLLIESVGRNPQAWNRINQFKTNMEDMSPAEGIVPQYFGENMAIRLPFSYKGFRVYTLPSLPFADLANWMKAFDTSNMANSGTGGAFEVARPILESAIPHYKFPIESMLNMKAFNNVPFRNTPQPAPKWANTPGVRELLLGISALPLPFTNLVQKNSSGELMMHDKQKYMFEQFMPLLGNYSRLNPNNKGQDLESAEAKQLMTLLNMSVGLGFRVNSTKEQRNEITRQMYQRSYDRSYARALG